MAQFTFSPAARRDIIDIWKYIAEDSADQAHHWRVRLHELLALIATQPRIGVESDAIQPGTRKFPFGSYMIYYRITRRGIQIVRVIHGKRDQRRAFKS